MTNQEAASNINDMSLAEINAANPNIDDWGLIPMGTSGTGIGPTDVIDTVDHLNNASEGDRNIIIDDLVDVILTIKDPC